jgi:hypothetical protein
MSNNVSQRQAIEVAVIRSMLSRLHLAGYVPSYVNDGEEVTRIHYQCGGPEAADRVLTLALNVDECRVGFNAIEGHERAGSVYLVFGNDGWDVISDWGWAQTPAGEAFNAALDACLENVEAIGVRAACKSHRWAWANPGGAHGGCIKCGRREGEGSVSIYFGARGAGTQEQLDAEVSQAIEDGEQG